MPKKQKRPLYSRPYTGAHPSLSLSGSTSAPHGFTGLEDNRSVTDSLNSLRIEGTKRLPLKPPPAATVHPSLKQLLDVPETPQPRPRPGMRTATPARTSRMPGPPPPLSWQLHASRHAPEIAERDNLDIHQISVRPSSHDHVSLPGAKRPSRGSLLHMALKAMAEQWHWHLRYDHLYLATIPLHLRETLLAYLARYATDECLAGSCGTLRTLFPDEKFPQPGDETVRPITEDASEVTRLDLGRALGSWLLKTSSLKKELMLPRVAQSFAISHIEARPDSRQLTEPPESWEDMDAPPNESAPQSMLSETLQVSPALRFSNLLHLSLALSPSSAASPAYVASWSSLLSIAQHLSTLESLSLGFWPCPTLTPHAASVSATISNPVSRTLPRIRYGGTDMYTESESSWREAAGILRRLSRHLYCLRWLDLTGCGPWFGALSWSDTEEPDDRLLPGAGPPEFGPDWNGSWRNVECLVLGVGWTPPNLKDDEQGSIASKTSFVDKGSSSRSKTWQNSRLGSSVEIAGADKTIPGPGLVEWDLQNERRKFLARKELDKFRVIQGRAHEVARRLRFLRERAKGKRIEIDCVGRQEFPASETIGSLQPRSVQFSP